MKSDCQTMYKSYVSSSKFNHWTKKLVAKFCILFPPWTSISSKKIRILLQLLFYTIGQIMTFIIKVIPDSWIRKTSLALIEIKTKRWLKKIKQLSNFAMGTILGKGFAQAQVHTNHSTSAEGTKISMVAKHFSPWRLY